MELKLKVGGVCLPCGKTCMQELVTIAEENFFQNVYLIDHTKIIKMIAINLADFHPLSQLSYVDDLHIFESAHPSENP